MTATPFALVSTTNRNKVLAYGIDINLPSGRDVVLFRREPDGRHLLAIHDTVDAALRRFSTITPLELRWEPHCRCCLRTTDDDTCELDGTCTSNPPKI